MTLDTTAREMGLIAELALAVHDLREFETTWLEELRPRLGFELACSVWTGRDGQVRHTTGMGYAEGCLRERFTAYMTELSPEEVAGFSGRDWAVDTDVLVRRRRQELTVYRELLAPHGVSSFVTNVWQSRFGVFGFHLARTGPTRRFAGRETQLLGRLGPCVKLAQAVLIGASTALRAEDWWVSAWGLSPREVEVARLAARGFSNPDVAALLRVSPHTVRNQLASVFRKADVTTRAELVFVMANTTESVELPRRARRQRGAWANFLGTGAR